MKVRNVDEALERIVALLRKRFDTHPEMRKKLKGVHRTLVLHVTDHGEYTLVVHDGEIVRIERGPHPSPDIRIALQSSDLLAILNREIALARAYLEKRIKVKASFSDLLLARSLLEV